MNDSHAAPVSGHERIETNNFLMIVLILLVVAVGGLVEIVPLFFQVDDSRSRGLKPYTPLQLAGRDVYLREGCYGCHSQMIRPLQAETLRYGHSSMAGESVYDHPFQWGSKRTGPDLAARGRQVQRRLASPPPRTTRATWCPSPTCPLPVAGHGQGRREGMAPHMRALRPWACPTPTPRSRSAATEVEGKTDQDALIAYLQVLGTAVK